MSVSNSFVTNSNDRVTSVHQPCPLAQLLEGKEIRRVVTKVRARLIREGALFGLSSLRNCS